MAYSRQDEDDNADLNHGDSIEDCVKEFFDVSDEEWDSFKGSKRRKLIKRYFDDTRT